MSANLEKDSIISSFDYISLCSDIKCVDYTIKTCKGFCFQYIEKRSCTKISYLECCMNQSYNAKH